MAGPAVVFREIHRWRRNARDLEEKLEVIPRQLKIQQARVARHEEAYREAQEAIKRLKVAVHDKEVSLRTRGSQIAKHQKQLNEAESKKEYDALQAEIAAEKAECQRLEESPGVAMMPSITFAVQPGSCAYSLSELAVAPLLASARSSGPTFSGFRTPGSSITG